MTAHIQPLAFQAASGVWSTPYNATSPDETFQREGTVGPPPGFPDLIQRPNGDAYTAAAIHAVHFTPDHIKEIEAAVEYYKGFELDGDEVNRERFPLPTLGSILDQCAREIHYGDGLCVLRGLDPKNYSVEDKMMQQLGVSDYIGDHRGVQSSKGAMISHVVESKSWKEVPKTERHGIHTNDHLPFHSDMGTEILALHVRETAKAGGRTCVSSMRAIYNDLRVSNPLVLHTLAKPDWPVRSGTKAYILCPLLEYHQGNLIFSMDPARIGPYPGNRAPPLTLEQEMAIAVLQNVAYKHQLKLDHQPGDFVFINNWTMLHAREAYQDGEATSRHLVRLWLRNSKLGSPVPKSMEFPWDCAFGRRSKLILNLSYPLVPLPVYMYSKYNSGTAAFVPTDDEEDEEETGQGASASCSGEGCEGGIRMKSRHDADVAGKGPYHDVGGACSSDGAQPV